MDASTLTLPITVTPKLVCDLMVTAFEGGITYWCAEANPITFDPDADDPKWLVAIETGFDLRLEITVTEASMLVGVLVKYPRAA